MQTVIKANTSTSLAGLTRLDDMVNKYYSVVDIKEEVEDVTDAEVDEVSEEEAAAASAEAEADDMDNRFGGRH